MGKLPWMQFYPADYLTDTRPLSPAARGIWMDLICHLWRAESPGALTYSPHSWSRLLGVTEQEFEDLLEELEEFNICDIHGDDKDDVRISSRRMVREQNGRQLNALYQRKHRDKEKVRSLSGKSKRKNQNQSHISESESESELEKEKTKLRETPAPVLKLKRVETELPADWKLNDRHQSIADGFRLNVFAESAKFKDHHQARGTKFKDWDAAFRTWLHKAVEFKEAKR